MADVKEKKVDEKKEAASNENTKKTAEVKSTKAEKTSNVEKNVKTEKATKSNTETKKSTTAKKEVSNVEKKVELKSEDYAEDYVGNDVEDNEELVAKATVKYERISSRKVKIVADLIRGKNVDEAMAILQFTNKAGAEVLTKLLKSAIANAENTKQMAHSKLYIAEIYSNQGPTLKRIRAAAKGSAVRIRKRTSHTTIVLKERD